MGDQRTVPIRFGEDDHKTIDIAESLSTVKNDARCLWIGGDETVSIERTTLTVGGAFEDHVSFPVTDFLPLPEGPDETGAIPEIDIEGMDRQGGYLWFVGSHSLTRKRVKAHQATEKALARLAKVTKNDNRYILGRIPVITAVDGLPTLVQTAPDPAAAGRQLTAAAAGLRKKTRLTEVLEDDEHLGRFLKIPSKDNGLDVEGLAVVGERVYLGLRGPVLRGWAVIIEIRLVEGEGQDLVLGPLDGGPVGGGQLADKAAPSYRKHFLDLDGLGVRDILAHGDDLLLLAGPTMDLDGPVRIYRWRDASRVAASVVVAEDDLERVIDVPYGDGDDHAEGITLFPGEPDSILVVYDSPAAHRRRVRHEILADVIPLP